MKKSNSNEKEVLWQDVDVLKRTLDAYRAIVPQLNTCLEEIKALGIEPGQPILQDLFEKGELIKKKLSKLLEKEIADFILPSRKEEERVKFQQILKKIDSLVARVDRNILERNIPHRIIIDTSLITWLPGGVVIDEQAIIDNHSVYLETDEQKRILELAKGLISKIEEFNREVALASLSQVIGFDRTNGKDWLLVHFYSDRTLKIDFECFKKIS